MQFNASHKGPIYRTDFCPSRTFLLLELVAGEDLIDRRQVLVLEPERGKTSIQVILCYGNFEIVVEEACPGGRPLGRYSQDAPGLLQNVFGKRPWLDEQAVPFGTWYANTGVQNSVSKLIAVCSPGVLDGSLPRSGDRA
jgi:hypothetical protein